MGLADPHSSNKIFKQATEYKKKGNISQDSIGGNLVHLDPNAKAPATYIADNQE